MNVAAPVTPTDRFKGYFADAWERICVLEAELAKSQARVAALEAEAKQPPEQRAPGAAAPNGSRFLKDASRTENQCP